MNSTFSGDTSSTTCSIMAICIGTELWVSFCVVENRRSNCKVYPPKTLYQLVLTGCIRDDKDHRSLTTFPIQPHSNTSLSKKNCFCCIYYPKLPISRALHCIALGGFTVSILAVVKSIVSFLFMKTTSFI